ncbi:alpha-2-macroglobulin family protein [Dysgonomonas sp. ZJ279]|uniref:alpha-2-macroglobulin family protein n=1 Tax=Dysgonomonas sp. ZJ279 TaxID=2709796 RepID=UPI0013ECCC23|nr:MG2 domain-containing protein [Dysgonomonas sp. ZJ279]
MSKKLTIFSLFSMILLLMCSSCKRSGNHEINPEFARYIAAFSYGKVSSTSDIQIELTQDIPSVELDKEIDQELFEFSPSIAGKAYWTSTRTIKFVPEPGQLKPGQEYEAWFKLDKVLQVESDFKEFYFYFHVPEQNFRVDILPYSPIKDNDLKWNAVQGTVTLADDANIDKVKSMFSLSGDGSKEAKVKITPTEIKGKYNLLIDSLRRESKVMEYTLHIDGSPISAKRTEDLAISLPQIGGSTFQVIDVRTAYEPQECIRITFSDPLSLNQNIQGLINPNGIENFSYDIQKNVLKLYLENYNGSSSIDLQIFKELKSFENKPLDKSYTYSLNFEKNKPAVKMINAGNILPNSENLVIPFQAVNLWAVDVKVIKIFENNILGYLQANNFGGSDELKRFGRLILKERIRLDADPTKNLSEWNDFPLDLSKMIKQDPGAVYKIEFSIRKEYSLYPCDGIIPQVPQDASLERFDNKMSEEDEAQWDVPGYYYYENTDWDQYVWNEREDPCKPTYYMNKTESCVVLASNIGMTAKLGSDKKLFVAINDVLTTKPLSGVTIDVYNYQMQRIGTAKTDGDGFASVDYKGGVPFVVIATKGKEKGYLKVSSNLSLSLSNFDVSGKEIQKGLKGYIYGERGVWRPGDSIYITFILEDKSQTLPKDHPVSLEFYTPRGQLYQRYMSTSGKDGFYAFRMATDPDAITGNWQALIKVGGATFSKRIKVETVKPNRLKIRLDAGKMIDASHGILTGSLSSQWLHGSPASNLAAKVEMTLTPAANPFEGYTKYSFNNPATNFTSDTYTIFEGRLDASGNATVRANLPQAASAPGMLKANIVSRVFESGGDASIYAQSMPYSPFSTYVGVKTPAESEYEWLETDKDNALDIITLTADGKPVNRSNINVKVYKVRWSWWWNENSDNLSSYVNNTSTEVVLDQNISTVGGKAKVNFRINYPEWGRYLVMVKDEQSGHTAGRILYVDWPSWRGRSEKQDPSGLTMLSFTTDKQTYQVGEKATVILPKSSKGRALISIENGSKVISREWVETSAAEDTKHTFTVTEEMNPNFYIFATLLQPHAQTDNDLPIRMYGVLNISVENKDTELTPVISMPDELRPEKEFTVSVSEKNKKDMTYTLAIVDDGLLDLTAFKTPNAWSDFYARQALGVRTWDMYDLVVGANAGKLGPLLSIGGDEALKPSNNTMNRFKPVVKYMGPFTLKGGKTDTHKITLPSYFGSVRTMIVAGNAKGAYGNAEKTVQVKNPLMILSTLPRVAGPDEEILVPVNVFAMDKKVKSVTVTVQSTGLFQFIDGTTKTVSFSDVGDKMVYFKVKVAKRTGQEKVIIKATGGGETATETIDIEVRNPNPAILLSEQALVSAGDTAQLKLTLDAVQSSDWVKLEVSRMPGINLNKNLSYLLEYPHGCTEQVTSKAFPLLYVATFRQFTDKEKEKIDSNIKEAIKIISSRQLGDGGIAYWPGNRYPTEWVTSYAGHFLIEAQRAGRDVPNSVIDKWKKFQKKTAQNWDRKDIYNSYYDYSMTDLQQAYRLYTLALAGDPELGAMNRLKEMSGLSIQARWRLAAAYAVAGKKDAANQLISNVSDEIENYSFNNNTYGSPGRDMAMIMETYLLLDKTDKALKLSRKVSQDLSANYISTQTASYGLIAMSKLAEKMGKGVISYEWHLNGVKQQSGNSGSVFQEITIKPQEMVNVNFKNTGQGELFVRLLGRTQPLGGNIPPQQGGVNLYVKYVDDNGKEIDVTSLRQGTEFYANVIVQNISGQALTDMALSQVFASGWEIFNNRLFNEAADSNSQSFNYQDIRDDRVLTYFNIGSGYSMGFKVKLQAAYCGRFYLPAVTCEAMYNPDEQSRSTGQWVEVKQ